MLNEDPAVLQQIQDCRVDDDRQLEKQLILALLECKEASIYDLTQKLYVSESTIYSLVKRMMPKFHSFSLSLQRRGEWLSCQGKETDKRRMLSHFFFAEANALATTLVNFDGYFSPFGLAELALSLIHIYRAAMGEAANFHVIETEFPCRFRTSASCFDRFQNHGLRHFFARITVPQAIGCTVVRHHRLVSAARLTFRRTAFNFRVLRF